MEEKEQAVSKTTWGSCILDHADRSAIYRHSSATNNHLLQHKYADCRSEHLLLSFTALANMTSAHKSAHSHAALLNFNAYGKRPESQSDVNIEDDRVTLASSLPAARPIRKSSLFVLLCHCCPRVSDASRLIASLYAFNFDHHAEAQGNHSQE